MPLPEIGQTVFIRPAAEFIAKGQVLSGVMRAPGVRLAVDGCETTVTSFLIERYRSGEIEIGRLPEVVAEVPVAEESPPAAPAAAVASPPPAAPTPSPTEVTP